jgi:pimeloyl-ACP methyl ester carboxylesterase
MGVWQVERVQAGDGTGLAVHTRGGGRPVLMLHGFLANTEVNWTLPGIADRLVDAGFRVIALDLRGHGQSDAPTDPARWPVDVLVDDGLGVISSLGLTDYDLVGYSLGARTAARMLVRGASPRRAVLGGMGASGIMEAGARAAMFEDSIRRGDKAKDPAAGRRVQAMIAHGGLKPEAMLGVLSSFAPTTQADLRGVAVPTLVISGEDDQDNGSAEDLAALLQHGRALRIPGNHLSAVGAPLGRAIVDYLVAP